MKNLSNFAEFSRGAQKEVHAIAKPIETSQTSIAPQTEKEISVPEKATRFSNHHDRTFNSKDATEVNKGMESFKTCYDVVHAEYLSILTEMNRIEYENGEQKKHVVDLKKTFNELLVKLQFFAEKGK